MLTLLVSILGDTYDRVKLAEKAEQTKARARVIHLSERMNRWMQRVLPAFEERQPEIRSSSNTNTITVFGEQMGRVYAGLAGER